MEQLCSFCIEKPQSPIILNCHHIMCSRCALNCSKRDSNNSVEIECYICNKKSDIEFKIRSDSPQKFSQPQSKPCRGQWDDQLKICQKSLSFIHNQQIYIKQFIDSQINAMIQLLVERQQILHKSLDDYLGKKLEYYQDCENKILNQKKITDNRQKIINFDVELYQNDKIMDFSNIKILTEEINKFGKRIVSHKKQSQSNNIIQQNKRINKENVEINCINLTLPSLENAQLIYRLGQKYVMPRFNRVFGLVEANGYKFGWYWDCDQINMGYSSGEAYIFTINNCYQTLPMKFMPKLEMQRYSVYLQGQKIGFGKDGKDLTLDFENLKGCHSELGNSYTLVEELNGGLVLGGRKSNWNVESIEIYQLK